MSMIGEQVADLREKALIFENSGCATNGIVKTFREAADTIEELSTKLATDNMERSTAYYNNGWIPCSERLPEKEGKYLCTGYGCHVGTYNFSNDLASIDDYDFPEYEYRNRKGFYVYDSEWGYGEVDSITAWMPLPEPYKGETK